MKRNNKRECSIQFKRKKMFLSASAGANLASQVDIYQSGNVMALVNASEGALHPIRNSTRSTRKDISCQSLYDYLMDQFQIREDGKLSAWYDRQGILLFGIPEDNRERELMFDGRFQKLEMPIERFESCTVSIDHGVLMFSRAAAERLSGRINFYEFGDVLCVESHPEGALTVEMRPHSSKGIASTELVDYIRRKFGIQNGRLMARICDGRVYFSNSLPPKDPEFSRFNLMNFSMTALPIMAALMKNGVFRISLLAAQGLTDWVEIQEWQDVVAVVPNDLSRSFHLNRSKGKPGATISSEILRRWIKAKFGCNDGVRFSTKLCGNAVCFSTRNLEHEALDLAQFSLRRFEENTQCFVSLSCTELYLSRGLGDCLKGRFDVQRVGETFALVANERGAFAGINRQRIIANRHLAEHLQREFGVTDRVRLFTQITESGIILSKRAPEGITTRYVGHRQKEHLRPSAGLCGEHIENDQRGTACGKIRRQSVG